MRLSKWVGKFEDTSVQQMMRDGNGGKICLWQRVNVIGRRYSKR